MKLKIFLVAFFCMCVVFGRAVEVKRFSTAGFYELASSGRTVCGLNPAWHFFKGDIDGASDVDFDDSAWSVVNLPNGIEILPLEASGGVNYQGVVWYRKHFLMDRAQSSKRNVLYFEAIMGKSKIWVNGTLVKEHFGGFTPIVVDISDYLTFDGDNVIAVMADNSDDGTYPPGKAQHTLDFCYFGGIYRDVWLVSGNKTCYITDANQVDKPASGGFFVFYTNVSEKEATVNVKLDVECASNVRGSVEYELLNSANQSVASWSGRLKAGENISSVTLKNPKLWSPVEPNLYTINIRVKNGDKVVDGFCQRIGIRTLKFTAKSGFILNGKPYGRKLIGANRHQDFAVIGNALSNNLHYRDAAKLKAAGMEIVRNAHYPQDPAFMDACDELGLFVIENTPGWQFWNEEPIFGQRVYAHIANIVRRDRNRPSVLLWEPILNETWYPEDFALNTHNIVKREIPYDGSNYTAADSEARGHNYFDIQFAHPIDATDSTKVYFNREWGDNVDDWNSHNSPSRVARQWGETAQLIQAEHYADPKYQNTSYANLLAAPINHIGGTLWHSFDHQRGYHPDPFYGGIMDAFRVEKFSYYMFQAQSAQAAPMVFMANELTPFSPADITVFSNCDAVRMLTPYGDTVRLQNRGDKMWLVFEKAWDFMADKALSMTSREAQKKSVIIAQGLKGVDNMVVCADTLRPARRPTKIVLTLDTMWAAPVATGGDLVVVRATMVDDSGSIKRLNNQHIRFTIEGCGELVASPSTLTNPAPILWGNASILVRTTTVSGPIKVTAEVLFEGDNTPFGASIEFCSQPAPQPLIYNKDLTPRTVVAEPTQVKPQKNREQINKSLKEVELHQSQFGE